MRKGEWGKWEGELEEESKRGEGGRGDSGRESGRLREERVSE